MDKVQTDHRHPPHHGVGIAALGRIFVREVSDRNGRADLSPQALCNCGVDLDETRIGDDVITNSRSTWPRSAETPELSEPVE